MLYRILLRSLLSGLLAAASLCTAQEAQPVAAPAAGKEGEAIPQPPTQEEISRLSPETVAAHSSAIKQVLLAQMLRTKEENRRVTPENMLACARLAQKLQAPASFIQLLQKGADSQLSPRERHDIQSRLTDLYKAYRVDETALLYYVEGSHLPADALTDAFSWLPISHLFNRLPLQKPDFPHMEADYVELNQLAGERARLYSGIQNTEQADAAALELAPLLARHADTLPTRILAEERDQQELKKRYGLITRTITQRMDTQRKRIQQENYYDSVRLRAIDYLFD